MVFRSKEEPKATIDFLVESRRPKAEANKPKTTPPRHTRDITGDVIRFLNQPLRWLQAPWIGPRYRKLCAGLWYCRHAMPTRKTPPHKTHIRNLLASGKLTDGERAAFQQMVTAFEQGLELTAHQKLWVETLVQKYLAK